MGWSATIRTGDYGTDQASLQEHQRYAHAQGLVLHVEPLAHGGFQVTASPAWSGAAPAYAQPSNPYAAPAHVARREHAGLASGECQACGRAARTKHVTLMQNIGVVFIRFPKTLSGFLCRHCIDQYFWEYTAISALFGWWGLISFFTTLVAIPTNIITYLGSRGLEAPPEDALSLAAKKSRGTWMAAIGALFALPFLLWSLAGVAVMASPDDPEALTSGLANVGMALVAFGVPAGLLLFFGVRGRQRASSLLAA